MTLNIIKIRIAFLLAFALFFLNMGFVLGAASFQVTAFSCSPSESVINNVFSCTATVKNVGDANGSVSTATLYPDATNWLESSSYPQSSGTSVNPGQTIDITFTGLKAVKSGNNGFSKVMLDVVTDTYVADQNKKVNIINVVVSVGNSVSSIVGGGTFTSTSEITAGGNIDVSLTFTYTSGGCSIGSQTNPKSFNSMTDGSKQSWAWTITQGTAGNCKYTVYATATGAGGVASTVDSTSSTITCSDCSGGGGPGGGGGGGGGSTDSTYNLGELKESQTQQILATEKISFSIVGVKHTLSISKLTDTNVSIVIESEKQEFTLFVGDEVRVDLNKDNIAEVSIKVKSIDTVAKKVTFVVTNLKGSDAIPGVISAAGNNTEAGNGEEGTTGEKTNMKKWSIYIVLIVIIVVVLIIAFLLFRKYNHKRLFLGYS